MPQAIPIQPVPAQTVSVLLGDQETQVTLRQMSTGLYMDVVVNNAEVVGLVICENGNRIVRNSYLGFQGDLMLYDAEGKGRDPVYTGLGTTFQLVYLTPEEVAGA
jgi:hypothetical protein